MAASVRFAVHVAEHACAAVLFGFSEHQAERLHEAHGWNLGEWPILATILMVVLLLATGAMIYRLVMFWRAHFNEAKRARMAERQRTARQRDAVQAATALLTSVAVALVCWQLFGGPKPPTTPAI